MGTRFTLNIVQYFVPELQIQYVSGVWWKHLNLKQLHYQDQNTKLVVSNLNYSLDASCLWSRSLCIEEFAIRKIHFSSLGSAPDDALSNEPSSFELPVVVSLQRARVDEFMFEHDASKIDVRGLRIQQLNLSNQLTVKDIQLTSVGLFAPESEESPALPIRLESISQWQHTPVTIPDIPVPFPIKVERFALAKIQWQQDRSPVENIIVADIGLQNNFLSIGNIQAHYEQSQVMGNFALTDSKNISSDLTLVPAETLTLPIKLERFVVKTSGSIADLRIQAKVENANKTIALLDWKAELSAPTLPTELAVNWTDLPLHEFDNRLQNTTGKLSIQGNLESFSSNLSLTANFSEYPALDLMLTTSGNLQQQEISLQQSNWQGIESDLQGILRLSESLTWQGNLVLNELKTEKLQPQLTAELEGTVVHQFVWDGLNWHATITDLRIFGNWLNETLELTSQAKLSDSMKLTVPQLDLRLGENKVHITSELSSEQRISGSGDIEIVDFKQIHPDLNGKLSLDAGWSGELFTPNFTIQARGENIRFNDVEVASLSINSLLNWQTSEINTHFQADQVRVQDQLIEQFTIATDGRLEEHTIQISANGPRINTSQEFRGELSEGLWQGKWMDGNINLSGFDINLDQHPTLSFNWIDRNASVTEHCWQQDNQSICIERLGWNEDLLTYHLSVNEWQVKTLLDAFLPAIRTPATDSQLQANLVGTWKSAGLPDSELVAEITPLRWHWPEQENAFNAETMVIKAKTGETGLKGELVVQSEQLGSLFSTLQMNADPKKKGLLSTWRFDTLNLTPWAEFIPALDELDGQLNGEIQLVYEKETLSTNGSLSLNRGHVLLNQYETDIANINKTILFKGQQADIDGTFQMGGGEGQLQSQLFWQNDISGVATLRGENLVFKNNHSRLTGVFSPDINVEFDNKKLHMNGSLVVPEAMAKIQQIPASAISPSSDTVLVRDEDKTKSKQLDVQVQLNLLVDPENKGNVKIDAFGLTSALRGGLNINLRDQRLQGSGDLSLVDGYYKAFGQQLIIQQGDILFAGPLEQPSLQIAAIRDPKATEDNVIAGIQVTGPATQPRVEVFSTPEKTQSEALSYLLRGKALNSSSSGTQEDAALNLLLSYGLSKGENLFARAGDKLGVEDLGVETQGQGDKTKVAVTGSIAPNIKVGYGVGVFDASSEVTVRYDLTKNLYLQAISGIDSALDIYYQFFFD